MKLECELNEEEEMRRFEHVTVGTEVVTEYGKLVLKGYNGSLLYADRYEYDESDEPELVYVREDRLTKSELAQDMKEVDGLNHNLIWDEPEEAEEEVVRLEDITSSASALYDGGWRFYDRDNLIKEYNLHPDDADAICEKLLEYDK